MSFSITINPETRTVTATARLFETADHKRLVDQDDPNAAFLFCTPGTRISKADADRFGLVERAAEPSTKEVKPKATKEVKPKGTKDAGTDD